MESARLSPEESPFRVPGPNGSFLFGNVAEFSRDPMAMMLRLRRDFFDAFREMYTLAGDLAALTLMSVDPEHAEAEVLRRFLDIGLVHLKRKLEGIMDVPEWIPIPRNQRFLEARKAADDVILRLIEERRRAGPDAPKDFLSALVRASEENAGSVDATQPRDEILTMFLAGFETNATALAFAIWLVATEAGWAAWLREELRSVLAGRPPHMNDLAHMPRTRMFLQETMRLYPPGWWMPRSPVAPGLVGSVRVEPGDVVVISPFVTQRHPNFWPEPERFDPLRFSDEAVAERPPGAYFPFGRGPRACIGESFAMTQMQLVFMLLVQRFAFVPLAGHDVGMAHMGVMRPRNGVLVRVQHA